MRRVYVYELHTCIGVCIYIYEVHTYISLRQKHIYVCVYVYMRHTYAQMVVCELTHTDLCIYMSNKYARTHRQADIVGFIT